MGTIICNWCDNLEVRFEKWMAEKFKVEGILNIGLCKPSNGGKREWVPHSYGVNQTTGLKFEGPKGIPLWNRCEDLKVNLGEMDVRRVRN